MQRSGIRPSWSARGDEPSDFEHGLDEVENTYFDTEGAMPWMLCAKREASNMTKTPPAASPAKANAPRDGGAGSKFGTVGAVDDRPRRKPRGGDLARRHDQKHSGPHRATAVIRRRGSRPIIDPVRHLAPAPAKSRPHPSPRRYLSPHGIGRRQPREGLASRDHGSCVARAAAAASSRSITSAKLLCPSTPKGLSGWRNAEARSRSTGIYT